MIDGTNCTEVVHTLKERVNELSLDAVFVSPDATVKQYPKLWSIFQTLDLEPHQRTNMCCAVNALQLALSKLRRAVSVESLIPHLCDVKWPGRLQNVILEPLTDRKEPILLDGAHNPQATEVLGEYVNRKLRPVEHDVTWVIAASRGKNLAELFHRLVKSGDQVVITSFGPVEGMPWVNAADPTELAACIHSIKGIGEVKVFEVDLVAAINCACKMAKSGPLIVAGSLYLASDLLRLLRDAQQKKVVQV